MGWKSAAGKTVRLTHLDGKLPNLALMKLSHFHKAKGDHVVLTRNAGKQDDEIDYDIVYGSAIFTRSIPLVERLKRDFPDAILGGTGAESYRQGTYPTVESVLGINEYEFYDYSIYPEFDSSIGFTQRGCRLACGFCIVPKKEGRPRSVNTIAQIYRGEPYPKNLLILDNDFFGQPREEWEARIEEIRSGGFKVSFNQGINIRLIDADAARAIRSIKYFNDNFQTRTIYTAWDNLKDEAIFTRGVTHLLEAGIHPSNIIVYMLIGYDPKETWDRIFYRLNKMLSLGILPYPMVYNKGDDTDPLLRRFQRYIIRRYYRIASWADYLHYRYKTMDDKTLIEMLEFDVTNERIEKYRMNWKLKNGTV